MEHSAGYRFHGRERVTIELDGLLDPASLAIPRGLELELRDGAARVRLFAFHVEDLRITGIPLVHSSYAEVLWRIAVLERGEPAWWVACCDLAALAPRLAARRWVRYPTRAASRVIVTEARIEVAASRTTLGLDLGAMEPRALPGEPRRLLVGPNAEWVVPWGDDAELAGAAAVTVTADRLAIDTLGTPVRWAATAAVRRGREHRCGTAQLATRH